MNSNSTQLASMANQTRQTLMAPPLSVALTGFFILICSAHFVTSYMMVATANLFVLLVGFTLRKTNRRAHALLMGLGMLSDLILVLTLQYQRNAIQTAIAFKLTFFNQAHILSSTTATALYIPMAVLGVQIYRNSTQKNNLIAIETQRLLHKRIGWLTLIFRTLGFFLMFSMLEQK